LKNIANKILIGFLLVFVLAFSSDSYVLEKTIETNAQTFTVDNLRNIYLIENGQTITKINSYGNKPFIFDLKEYGKIKYIDVQNPMKILVLYPEFSIVLALDNTLSQVGKYDFNELSIPKISAVCMSFDNNIWIYDELDYKLKKFDKQANLIRQSEDITTLLGFAMQPDYMVEQDNLIYIIDKEQGIIVFDIYATYYKTIPIKNIKHIQVLNEQLVYQQGSKAYTYHLKTLEKKELLVQEIIESDTKFFIDKDKLFVLKNKELQTYKIK